MRADRSTKFKSRFSILRILPAALFALFAATASFADPVEIELAAQPLSAALREFARQAGVQIAVQSQLTDGKMAPALRGKYERDDALTALLKGTGLVAYPVNATTIGIRETRDVPQKHDETHTSSVEQIVVTGSRLARATSEGPQDVKVYGRKQIQESGQASIADFLNTLPEVSTGSPENGKVFAGQTTVSLRGLPLGTTLVLINGRRVENGGATAYYGGYFDLNNIPSSAVQRIEIVAEGSSAIYGSDALAGVVNIILDRNVEGIDLNAHFGTATGIDEGAADVSWGKQWTRGSISLFGNYYARGQLNGTERSVSSSNAIGTLGDRCSPGNVYSADGSNLPGLQAPSAGVMPDAANGFSPGQINQCRQYFDKDLIPSSHRATALATGDYRVTDSIQLFSELLFTHVEQDFAQGQTKLYRQTLPATNAFNPFGQDVQVSYAFNSALTESSYNTDSDFVRALIGARGELPADWATDWNWELAAWQSQDKTRIDQPANRVNYSNLDNALASSDPASALNLFTDGPAASYTVLSSIYSNAPLDTLGRSQIINGFVRGTVMTLPAGPVSAVLGSEYVRAKVSWEAEPDVAGAFSYQRHSTSAFSELRVPLLASRSGDAPRDVLAVTGAVRYDHYSDFGGHTTPQYALEWRPLPSLLVRGAYTEAFKAPNFVSVYGPTRTFAGSCCVTDPQHGGLQSPYIFIRGGNPDLKPESGKSKSLGMVWSPQWLDGGSASLTWWDIDQDDQVTSLTAQEVVDNEDLFPGRVTRDATTGTIQAVNVGFLNFGELKVSGFDFRMSRPIQTALGRFTPSVAATQIYRYEATVTPGALVDDRLGRAAYDAWAPRWKGTVNIAWSHGAYSANVLGRYVGRYTDYQDLGPTSRQLGEFWVCDVSATYALGTDFTAGGVQMRDAFIQMQLVNAFDSLPKYSAFAGGFNGYDPAQSDIRGRFIAINLGVRL